MTAAIAGRRTACSRESASSARASTRPADAFLVEVCARCAAARIADVRAHEGQHVITSYAETLAEALLGRPLDEDDLDRVATGVVMN